MNHSSDVIRVLAYFQLINPIALRKAKIVYNFGLSGCSRVKTLIPYTYIFIYIWNFSLQLSIIPVISSGFNECQKSSLAFKG